VLNNNRIRGLGKYTVDGLVLDNGVIKVLLCRNVDDRSKERAKDDKSSTFYNCDYLCHFLVIFVLEN
jgi:hypothetical protein